MLRARSVAVAALSAALLVMAGLAAAPAQARPDMASFEVVESAGGASDQAIIHYWTPERMASAVPADEHLVGEPAMADEVDRLLESLPEEHLRSEDLADPAAPPTPGVAPADAAHFSHNTGKVFFTTPTGQNMYCSASALNSESRSLVLTAGHCLHTGQGGGWNSNVAFVPAYHQGSRPYGTFPWRVMTTFTAWIDNSDRRRDVGMVATASNASGQLLVNTVGGHGLTINPSRQTYVHIVGYPGNRDNGEVQWNCWGTTSRWSLFDGGLKLSCGWEGGSSGSPWLRDYSSNGLGWAVGVMHGYAGADNYSPYFDSAVGDMYNDMRHR